MHTKHLIALLLSTLLLTGCELETSHNGKLDGNWQLRKIDTLATGGICDMSYSYIYWAVQNDLLQVRDIDNGNQKYFFRFQKQGNQLTISAPHRIITKDELQPLETAELLLPFGIIGTEDTFTITQLSNGSLTLNNTLYRLHFRKY